MSQLTQRYISFFLCPLVFTLAAGFTAFTPATKAEASNEPLAVVVFSGYDALMNDIDFVGNLGNVPNLSAQVDGMLGMFTQGKGLVGLDKSKPIGVVVEMDENGNPSGALCMPVTSLEELIGTGAPFGVTGEKQADGSWQIGSQGQMIFATESNGWAFLAPAPAMLEGAPGDPGALFGAMTKEYDLAVQVNVQQVPEAQKQMLVGMLGQAAQQGVEQLADESDEDFQDRQRVMNLQLKQFEDMVQQVDEVTFGLSLDGGQQRTFMDFIYTAVAGSDLAKQFSGLNNTKTNQAGFIQPEAAMMMVVAVQNDEMTAEQKTQVEQGMQVNRMQLHTVIDDQDELDDAAKELMKSAADDFLDSLKATALSGKFDMGAVMNVGSDAASMLFGGYNADPAKVESGIKKLVELAKENDEFPGVKWNADSHNGVQFHTVTVPVPADEEEAQQIFGQEVEIVVGIGKDSVYAGAGRDAIADLKAVMDASASDLGKSVPPMEMSFALTQIMDFAGVVAKADGPAEATAAIEMVANMLANDANGRDHVRILSTAIPNGSKTRIEAEEGVLRAIGMMLMQAKMQQQGAGF
ncbi:hypothetical protein [Adhaeretor mobilis]|uniref:hypothetical protein n=1 Tax=Adhaeretor mobilis TaxID=1930276 RepID=UPI0011A2385E|nr:hypothetical protein [Adhaeretor mobilis]